MTTKSALFLLNGFIQSSQTDPQERVTVRATDLIGIREALQNLANPKEDILCSECNKPIRKNDKGQYEHFHPNGEVRHFCHVPSPKSRVPKLNIKCVCSLGLQKWPEAGGRTNLPVIRVEEEDDGSFTAVTDYWPRN